MQAGVALTLGIPGETVMGLFGPEFVGGTGALAFLLAAEVTAATAVVSEAALVYIARHRNLWISLGMLALQPVLSVVLILAVDYLPVRDGLKGLFQAAAVACALMLALGISSVVKAIFLSSLLSAPVDIWRWPLLWAIIAASMTGIIVVALPPAYEWAELALGIPIILGVYSWVIWMRGFDEDDRMLFRRTPKG